MEAFEGELRLDDPGRLDSGAKYVLLRWNVVWRGNSVEIETK